MVKSNLGHSRAGLSGVVRPNECVATQSVVGMEGIQPYSSGRDSRETGAAETRVVSAAAMQNQLGLSARSRRFLPAEARPHPTRGCAAALRAYELSRAVLAFR